MRTTLAILATTTLLFAAPALAATPINDASSIHAESGHYKLDPHHASITFRINHLGFSYYTGRFNSFDAALDLDAQNPDASKVSVKIDPNSIDTHNSELEATLMGDKFFDTKQFNEASFTSTSVKRTGINTADITGDLTLHGVTKPITLKATLVGAGIDKFANAQKIGFSATTHFPRSDFGINAYLPMVGDDVTLTIETEFAKEAN